MPCVCFRSLFRSHSIALLSHAIPTPFMFSVPVLGVFIWFVFSRLSVCVMLFVAHTITVFVSLTSIMSERLGMSSYVSMHQKSKHFRKAIGFLNLFCICAGTQMAMWTTSVVSLVPARWCFTGLTTRRIPNTPYQRRLWRCCRTGQNWDTVPSETP